VKANFLALRRHFVSVSSCDRGERGGSLGAPLIRVL
jgi:hypothetical protein